MSRVIMIILIVGVVSLLLLGSLGSLKSHFISGQNKIEGPYTTLSNADIDTA